MIKLLSILLLVCASGCGSAFATYVEVGQDFQDSARELRRTVRTYRTDEMRAAAREVHETGGSLEAAQAAARARGAELEPLVEAQQLYASAVYAFISALYLARDARDGFTLGAILPAFRDLLDVYRELREFGQSLSVPWLAGLPALPGFLQGVPELTGGATP